MEFGIDICATLVLKRRRITNFDRISLPAGKVERRMPQESPQGLRD